MNIAVAEYQAWESLYDDRGSDESSSADRASDVAKAGACRKRTRRAVSNRIRRDENRSREVYPNRSIVAPREKEPIAVTRESFLRPPPAPVTSPTIRSPVESL